MKLETKKILSLITLGIGVFYAGSTIAALNNIQVSPFTDILTVKLVGKHPDILAVYADNNGVDISGDKTIPSDTESFPVTISSQNSLEGGTPSMAITTNNTTCKLKFQDGPFSACLNYFDGIPVCANFTASAVKEDSENPGQGYYHINLAYRDPGTYFEPKLP